MRPLLSRLTLAACAACLPAIGRGDELPTDFLLSILRFGIECKQVSAPRNVYIGDATRFAVTVEPAQQPGGQASPGRVTYRAFYRDLQDPSAHQGAVTLRCKGTGKCIDVYRGKTIDRTSSVELATCSPRTATLVKGAAHIFIASASP